MKDLNKNKEQIIKKAQKLMKKLGISELENGILHRLQEDSFKGQGFAEL